MERNEFLKSLGLGLALVCSGSCMSGCGKGNDGPEKPDNNPPPGGSNNGGGSGNTATIDISNQLKAIGDQAKVNGVLFFRVASGDTASAFVATESVCPHQQGSLVWKQALNRIQCQLHFSEYSSSGSILQGPQNSAGNTRTLKVYSTVLNGNTLTATIS